MDTRTSPARLHIERIRDVLRAEHCAAVLVPTSDPHLSEYLPERWQARQWASGFTGSMATLVVTLQRAALFADSRYWVQAERQLEGSGIELVRIPTPPGAQHIEWMCRQLARGDTVAVDGDVLGLAAARQLKSELDKLRHRACAAISMSSPRPGTAVRRRRPPPSTSTSLRRRPNRARAGCPGFAPPCATPARRITSSPPSTTSPGCSTCAEPTSPTTRCSSPTCW